MPTNDETDAGSRVCPECGAPVSHVATMPDMKNARHVSLFRCECGKLIWKDGKSFDLPKKG